MNFDLGPRCLRLLFQSGQEAEGQGAPDQFHLHGGRLGVPPRVDQRRGPIHGGGFHPLVLFIPTFTIP